MRLQANLRIPFPFIHSTLEVVGDVFLSPVRNEAVDNNIFTTFLPGDTDVIEAGAIGQLSRPAPLCSLGTSIDNVILTSVFLPTTIDASLYQIQRFDWMSITL